MIKTIENEPAKSWLHRARPECTSSATAVHDLATCRVDDSSGDFWDPWDVWLLYIDQPRRHRASRRLKSVG